MSAEELARIDWENGMTAAKIAEKYSISVNTVKSWIKRKWKQGAGCKQGAKGATPHPAPLPISPDVTCKIGANDNHDEITDQQQDFCACYVSCNFKATKAAIQAGYSEKTAGQIGYQLLQKPSIRKEVERLKRIKLENHLFSEDDLLDYHIRNLRADINDYVKYEAAQDGEDSNKHITMSFRDQAETDGTLVNKIAVTKDGASVTLVDKRESLRFLERYFELNPMDRHRKEYETRKLELELLKVQASLPDPDGDSDSPRSNFAEAMGAAVGEVWSDEDGEDQPEPTE